MARLTALPEKAVIDSLKGVLDFYLWKGIPVCRKWPHWPQRSPTPAEKANQDAFSFINKQAKNVQPFVRLQFERMAAGTPLTWKDMMVRSYMHGIKGRE